MEKIGCLLETPPVSWWYSLIFPIDSENPQAMRTISREVLCQTDSKLSDMTPQRLHADSSIINPSVLIAYLNGALHDGTRSCIHMTHRISQKGSDWLMWLQGIFDCLGHKSWIYQEGRSREVFVLESSAKFVDKSFDPDQLSTSDEQIAYVRGYFDAEGGIPRHPRNRFYVQITQKNRVELSKVLCALEDHGVSCGVLHNPSVRVDPDYWRFFVRTRSHQDYIRKVGSWHPRKEDLLLRMMI